MCGQCESNLVEKTILKVEVPETAINVCFTCGAGAYIKDDVIQTIAILNRYLKTGKTHDLTEAMVHFHNALDKAQDYSGTPNG